MCGIAGYVNRDGAPASATIARRMGDFIRHRGPDDEGVLADRNVALAHRRLSILDLTAAGHQPMASADGNCVIVFNGEIYNHLELRAELETQGVRLRSRTDTEVLLEGLARHGETFLTRINGMFAFALYDRRKHRLLLARDRFGVKPLYFAEVGGALLFGSEIKAFLAHPGFSAKVDAEGLVEYMTFQNFFGTRTLFAGVSLLPAGATLTVDCAARAPLPAPRRYWDFRFAESSGISRPEAVDRLDGLFRQAVSRQLMSDVPIGTYLSGGMDSGSITTLAARELPGMLSFTVGFDLSSASGLELAFDERGVAERIAALAGTEHYEMVLKAGDMERCMEALVWHMEEPRVGQSYPNFYAAKLASRFGKVVLSGAGGDELFAGYPWRYYRAAINDDFNDYASKYYLFWQRLLPAEAQPTIFAPLGPAAAAVDPIAIFRSVFDSHAQRLERPEDYINHSLYFEAKTFLNGLLVVEDKLSMAHGLESRVPFLDNDLVDFATTLPVSYKLNNLGEAARVSENEPGGKAQRYFQKTRDGKILLREAMARYIPEDICWGVKQGFSAPDASWFRGASIDFVRRRLLDDRAPIYEYLDRATVRGLVDDHLEGRENRRLLIWSLLYLSTWLDVWINRPPSAPK
jgi:asparagine synthase (glutamine-hydrolysing)